MEGVDVENKNPIKIKNAKEKVIEQIENIIKETKKDAGKEDAGKEDAGKDAGEEDSDKETSDAEDAQKILEKNMPEKKSPNGERGPSSIPFP